MDKRDIWLFLLLLAVVSATGMVSTAWDAPPADDLADRRAEALANVAAAITPAGPLFPEDTYPDPLEDDQIEAALVEQGYFREDVPLSFEEQDYLQTACREFCVEYPLMLALIERETNFRNIPGDDGKSMGYCQIQEKWWRGLMDEIGAEDLSDPYDNFRTSCAIIAQLTERYGDLEDALTAYNTGSPGESKYAAAILKNMEAWRVP